MEKLELSNMECLISMPLKDLRSNCAALTISTGSRDHMVECLFYALLDVITIDEENILLSLNEEGTNL